MEILKVHDENTTHLVSNDNAAKKRKSSDGIENNENIVVPNISSSIVVVGTDDANKRIRSSRAATSGGLTSNLAKPRSALPRYNVQRPSTSSASALPGSSISSAAEKKRAVIELSTAERSISNSLTPTKLQVNSSKRDTAKSSPRALRSDAVVSTPGSSNINLLIRRLQKLNTQTMATDKLRVYFDNAFSFTEDKVSAINSSLKVKTKWDVKDKCKKQECAIKDFRDGLATTMSEAKTLREYCLEYELEINRYMKDACMDIQDSIQTLSTIRSLELSLSKSVEENHALKDLKSKAIELTEKLAYEEKQKAAAIDSLDRIKIEYEDLKAREADTHIALKSEFEQHLKCQKDELELLRAEVSRRKQDCDRATIERNELDHRALELKEELVKVQSSLKVSESSVQRYEKDVEKSSTEYTYIKEQLAQKDTDLRSAFNSLNEIQKQTCDERARLRDEIASLQIKVHTLEEEKMSVSIQLGAKREEYASVFCEISLIKEAAASLESKLANRDAELLVLKESAMQLELEKELRSRCEHREEAERHERIAACAQLLATQTECTKRMHECEESCRMQILDMKNQVVLIESQRDASIDEARKQGDITLSLDSEVRQLKHALENASTGSEAVEQLGRVTGELEILRRRMRETTELKQIEHFSAASRISDLESQIKSGEVQRRKLHNLVQELRGNVRVFARVRPFLPNDGVDLCTIPDSCMDVRSDASSVKITKRGSETDRPEEFNFSFDRVFGQSNSQESIFDEVSEFVQSALDGYNVCLFSYGQTGSGKTHTMQGSGSGSMRGIIPRAMQQVGLYKVALEEKGWSYEMSVSFIEIYNESIRDLLRSSSNDDLKHEIKKDIDGNVSIENITIISVDPNCTEQIDSIMELAARHRSIGQTAMNEHSSRSHSIFALHLKATNIIENVTLKGTLSLVDLAGSERLDRSGVTGARMKESVAINKSLSALTDVFVAIGNKQPHIPFRNSKLTYLLQPALSGDGKTLMLVNLSPTEESYYESLCSLRFASQVNQCELGKPKRHLNNATISQPQSQQSKASSSTVLQPLNRSKTSLHAKK